MKLIYFSLFFLFFCFGVFAGDVVSDTPETPSVQAPSDISLCSDAKDSGYSCQNTCTYPNVSLLVEEDGFDDLMVPRDCRDNGQVCCKFYDCTALGGACSSSCSESSTEQKPNDSVPKECEQSGQVCCKPNYEDCSSVGGTCKTFCDDEEINYTVDGFTPFECTSPGEFKQCCVNEIIQSCTENVSSAQVCSAFGQTWCCPIQKDGIFFQCNQDYGKAIACVEEKKEQLPNYSFEQYQNFFLECGAKVKGSYPDPCFNRFVEMYSSESSCTVFPEIIEADKEAFDIRSLESMIPSSCTCENSALVIVGLDILDPSYSTSQSFLYGQLQNCAKIKEKYGECTFSVVVKNESDMELLSQLGKRFKHITISSHGAPWGTTVGGTHFASRLLCENANVTFYSCLVGARPIDWLFDQGFYENPYWVPMHDLERANVPGAEGLGIPLEVKNTCANAPNDTLVWVSESSIIQFPTSGEATGYELDPNAKSYCSVGTPACWKCLGDPNGDAVQIDCNEQPFDLGIILGDKKLSRSLLDYLHGLAESENQSDP